MIQIKISKIYDINASIYISTSIAIKLNAIKINTVKINKTKYK
mgnify:CR=1 FL=1